MKPADQFTRWIIHLDMDAFYASVEVLDDPTLKGRPVVVGGISGRGVVSAASYEARSYGIHSAQPMAQARRLCPGGIFLPVRMARYQEISLRIFRLFREFTPLVEPLSIDEAFLDITGSLGLFGPPEILARRIKERVRDETGLTVSAGVAPNKFLAKVASDLEKPDGLTLVPPERFQAFLDPLSVARLWGVGPSTRQSLHLLGVKTIGDLRALPLSLLENRFGRPGRKLYDLARGLDEREVQPASAPKSIGHEETYGTDLTDLEAVRRRLLALCQKVARRMRREGFAGRTVTLKVTYHDFTRVTRSLTLKEATDDGRIIYQTVSRLLPETEAGRQPLRLLGVSLSRPAPDVEAGQLRLPLGDPLREKGKRINQALDTVHQKFGTRALGPGSLLGRREP